VYVITIWLLTYVACKRSFNFMHIPELHHWDVFKNTNTLIVSLKIIHGI